MSRAIVKSARQWLIPGGIFIVGAAVTWLIIAVSFDSFVVVGDSTPATIWGPALGRTVIWMGAAVLLGCAAFAQGRTIAVGLLLWLLFLTAATHRLVERSDGRVQDEWLGITLQELDGDPASETLQHRCRVTRWSAICVDVATGHKLVTLSPLPMAALIPGKWETNGQ